ncbi:MAG: DMT family transporter, partial [Alphaproteobacteria bacterium]
SPAEPGANRRGIIAMVTATAFFIVNDTLVKLATIAMPSGQLIAIRGIFATIIVLCWVWASGYQRDLPRALTPLVLVRGVLEGVVAFLFITALAFIPIADITAIFLVAPLLITAASALMGEAVGWRRWLAVFVGFVGMLMVVKPGGVGFGWPVLLAVASTIFVAARDLLTRRIDASVPTLVITVVTCVSVTLVGALGGIGQGFVVPDGRATFYLFAASTFLVIGNYAMIQAFRGVDIAVVSPFRYSIMIWSILAGIIVWGEWPDAIALGGIALIVGSGLYTLHRERIRQRERSHAVGTP